MRLFGAVGGFLLVVALSFGGGYWFARRNVPTPAAIAATERSIDLLDLELSLLRPRYELSRATMKAAVDTEWVPARAIIERYRDSLFVPVPLVIGLAQAGDKVVSSCSRLEADCTELVATEKARGDSLRVVADNWKSRARGPLIELGLAGMVGKDGVLGRADARLRITDHFLTVAEIEQRVDSAGRSGRIGVRYRF